MSAGAASVKSDSHPVAADARGDAGGRRGLPRSLSCRIGFPPARLPLEHRPLQRALRRALKGLLRRALPTVVFTVLLAVPVAAPAQEAQGTPLDEVLARSGYSAEDARALRRLFEDARGDGIPAELLLPRLEEGVAKRVPAVRVGTVLRQNLEQLREARALLGGLDGGEALLADSAAWLRTANLRAAGVPAADITAIAAAAQGRRGDYRQATALYVSSVDWGISREDSRGLAVAALASPIPGESFAGLIELLTAGRRQRLAPEELLRRIREQLPQVQSLEQLQERVLYE